LLVIPVVFTVFATTDIYTVFAAFVPADLYAIFAAFATAEHRFFFRAGVSLSCAAIVCLASGRELGQTKWWVVAGLAVSVIGDWFMVHKSGNLNYFICAISMFFIAHTCFCAFCLIKGRIDTWFLFVLLTGYLPFFFVVLRPEIPQPALFIAVLVYLLVSCLSLSAAAGLRLPAIVRGTYMEGIALFVFSDTIIALTSFAGYRGDLKYLILPTYFASHTVITLALVLMGIFAASQSKNSQISEKNNKQHDAQ